MLCCGILRRELEHVLQDKEVEIHYLDPGLHVDFDKLEKALARVLDGMKGDSVGVMVGLQCHPEMERLVAERGGRVVRAKNCIEMLMGERLAELDETPEELLAAFPQGAETTCQVGDLKMTAGEAGKLLKSDDFPFKSAEEVAEIIVERAGL